MILVFIFIFLIWGCIFSKVSVYVKNFNLQNSKKGLNTIFNIKLKFKLYGIIPFLVMNLTEEGIRILGIKIDYKKFTNNEKIKKGIKKAKKNFKVSKIKLLKPNLEKINLRLSLGTESMVITTFLVTLSSVFLSFVFKETIKKFDKNKHKYIIRPNYEEKNKIFLEFKGILNIKTSNIIECIKYI